MKQAKYKMAKTCMVTGLKCSPRCRQWQGSRTTPCRVMYLRDNLELLEKISRLHLAIADITNPVDFM